MFIYLIVAIDNLKIYGTSMLDEEEEHVLPSLEDLEPDD